MQSSSTSTSSSTNVIPVTVTLQVPVMGHPNDPATFTQRSLANDQRVLELVTLKVGFGHEETEFSGILLSLGRNSLLLGRDSPIYLPLLDPEAVKLLIGSTFTGTLIVTELNVAKLILAANYLEMEEIKNACLDIQGKFTGLPAGFTDLSFVELKKAIESCSRHDRDAGIFKGITIWAEKDESDRMHHLFDLLKLVNLSSLLDASEEIENMVNEAFENGIFKTCDKCCRFYTATVRAKFQEYKRRQSQPAQRVDEPGQAGAGLFNSIRINEAPSNLPDSGESNSTGIEEAPSELPDSPSAQEKSKPGPSRKRKASSIKAKGRKSILSTPQPGPSCSKSGRSATPSSIPCPDDSTPNSGSFIQLIYAIFENRKRFIRTYNFQTKTRTTRAVHEVNLPRRLSTLVYHDDEVFDIGGTTDLDKIDGETKPTNVIEIFHRSHSPSLNKMYMKDARRHAQTCVCGEYLYVIGGCYLDRYGYDATRNTVERLNLCTRASNKWKKTDDMLYFRGAHAACVLEGKIFVTGGIGVKVSTDEEDISDDPAVHLRTVECFDPAEQKWTELSPMFQARAYHKMVTTNGKIYAVGGSITKNNQEVVLNTVEVFNPDDGTWAQCSPMKKPRQRLLLIAQENRLLAIGGDSVEDSTMEVFDVDKHEWNLSDWPEDLPKDADFYSAIQF